MGNIKHNDELLRINDDGFDVVFNCDNKHQNGVSYHAEKNGKKTKIDPEYAMAALVKKVSDAGWPADMPVPSAGGYGYTEQGEQTVVVDNESVVTEVDDPDFPPSGRFTSFEIIKDKAYTVILDDTEYNAQGIMTDLDDGPWMGDFSFETYPFVIIHDSEACILLTENEGTHTLSIKTIGEEIHKINEKYLPEPEGGDNVDMIISRDTDGHFVIESGSFELIHEKMGNGAMPKIVYVHPTNGTPNDYELSYRVSGNASSLERDSMVYVYFSSEFELCVDTDNNVYEAE